MSDMPSPWNTRAIVLPVRVNRQMATGITINPTSAARAMRRRTPSVSPNNRRSKYIARLRDSAVSLVLTKTDCKKLGGEFWQRLLTNRQADVRDRKRRSEERRVGKE